MEPRLTRAAAARALPRLEVNSTVQVGVGVLFLAMGVGIAAIPVVALVLAARVVPFVGFLIGVLLYLSLRGPIGRTGALVSASTVLDAEGLVRVVFGLASVQRAERQFTDARHLGKEFLLGIGFVVVLVAVSLGLALAGIILGFAGACCAGLGIGLAESGLATIKVARIWRTGTVPLDGAAMTALLAGYLHVGGTLDEVRAGLPADVLLNRLRDANEDTLNEAVRYGQALAAVNRAARSAPF